MSRRTSSLHASYDPSRAARIADRSMVIGTGIWDDDHKPIHWSIIRLNINYNYLLSYFLDPRLYIIIIIIIRLSKLVDAASS